jgi:hypothetical protein
MRGGHNKILIATCAIAMLAGMRAARGSAPETPIEKSAGDDAKPDEKKASDQPADKAGKKPGGAKDDGTTDEHPLSPVLEQAIRQKEK